MKFYQAKEKTKQDMTASVAQTKLSLGIIDSGVRQEATMMADVGWEDEIRIKTVDKKCKNGLQKIPARRFFFTT